MQVAGAQKRFLKLSLVGRESAYMQEEWGGGSISVLMLESNIGWSLSNPGEVSKTAGYSGGYEVCRRW